MTGRQVEPLVNSRNEEIILCDMACMFDMQPQIAQGYVTLLTPGNSLPKSSSSKKKKKSKKQKEAEAEEAAYLLAFLAVTEGNVVDACFGVQPYSKVHNGLAFARRAKGLIAEAVDSSEAICKLAVDTYRESFVIVLDTNARIRKLNFLIRCFCSGRIKRRGRASLKATLQLLEEAIGAST
jgi:hypothetical protein